MFRAKPTYNWLLHCAYYFVFRLYKLLKIKIALLRYSVNRNSNLHFQHSAVMNDKNIINSMRSKTGFTLGLFGHRLLKLFRLKKQSSKLDHSLMSHTITYKLHTQTLHKN